MRPRSLALTLLVALPACLNPYGEPQDTDTSGSTSATSTGGETTGPMTTGPMTTGPDLTTGPTSGVEAVCGDGLVEGDEQCDLGPANADDGDCTAACKSAWCGDGLINKNGEECDAGPDNKDTGACTSGCRQATCGDELLQEGVEACDDGVNDGKYGGCAVDCSALAPACGDGQLDPDFEQCDGEPACIAGECAYAKDCLDHKAADPAAASGLYLIRRDGVADPLQVWCAMDDRVDGGGYTFLKVDVDTDLNDLPFTAKKAEFKCAEFGMKLLIPRSQAHLKAAYGVALSDALTPLGGGAVATGSDYLRILGIYPVTPGVSCVDKPINSADCPEWAAGDSQSYWIGAAPVGLGEPDPDGACFGCSMSYTWNLDGTVKKYVAIPDVGGSSFRFLCDTRNKLP